MRQRLVANPREFLRLRTTQSFPRRQSFALLFSLHSAAAIFALFWLGIALTLADSAWAQRARGGASTWRTASELAKHLEEPVTWSWSGQTLSKALAGLAETDRLPSFLDRRVDPGKKLEVAVVNAPLRQALGKAASQGGVGVSVLGPVVYWGPKEAAERLRTLAELRRQVADELRPQLRLALSTSKPLVWPRLTEPRAVVEQLAAEAGLTLAAENSLPHDLWPAADLPPLPWTDRLTLVLAGFDLTYEIDEGQNQLRLVPAPARPTIARSFPLRGSAEKTLADWRERAPQAEVRVQGSKVEVRALLEDFERVAAKPKPAPRRNPRNSQQVFRLNMVAQDQAVGTLVRKVADGLGWQAIFDEEAIKAAGLSLERPVSVSAEGATPEELFRDVLEQAGLGFRIEGETIRVFPPKDGQTKK